MAKLFDAHTHVQFAAFKEDYKEVMKRALAADIGVINVGTQKDTSRNAVGLAAQYKKDVYAIVGLHPIHTDKSFHDRQELGGDDNGFTSRGEEFDYDFYKKLALHEKVVAIGECGLDFFRLQNFEYRKTLEIKEKQIRAFQQQIKLAEEIKKPLMIHCRPSQNTDDAYEQMLEIVENENPSVPLISHFYAGSPEMTKKLLAAGFYFTFGGVITFTRAYDEVINLIPIKKIMLETDAPYVTPAPYRGKRNEPLYVQEVAKKMAELKNISLEKIAERTTETVRKVFRV